MFESPSRLMTAHSQQNSPTNRRAQTAEPGLKPETPIIRRMDEVFETETRKIDSVLHSVYSNDTLVSPMNSLCNQILKDYLIIRRATTVMPRPDNLGQIPAEERIDIEKKKSSRIFFQISVLNKNTPLRIRFSKKMTGSINLLVSKKDKFPWYNNTVDFAIQIKAAKIVEIRAGEKKRVFSFSEIYLCVDCKTDVIGSFVCYFPGAKIDGILGEDEITKEAPRAKTAFQGSRSSRHYSIESAIFKIRNDKTAYQDLLVKVESIKRKKRDNMLKLSKNKNIMLFNRDAAGSVNSIQTARETNRIKHIIRAEQAIKTKVAIDNEIFANRLFFQRRWEIRNEQVPMVISKGSKSNK
jgi:hypothetical protein